MILPYRIHIYFVPTIISQKNINIHVKTLNILLINYIENIVTDAYLYKYVFNYNFVLVYYNDE